MKKVLCIFLIALCCNVSKAQNKLSGNQQAVAVLRAFYTAYMTEVASSNPPKISEKKLTALKTKYCTTAFLTKLEKITVKYEMDWDPMIKAQDSRMDCVKNLSFKKSNRSINAYTVSYFYMDEISKKKEITNIDVIVENQPNGFKIASVYLDTPNLPERI